MSPKTKNIFRRRRRILTLLGVLAAACLVLVVLFQYNKALSANILDMSRTYLQEISNREILHLEKNLDEHYGALDLSALFLKGHEGDSVEALQAYLSQLQHSYAFDFLALIDENGEYCSTTRYGPAMTESPFFNRLLQQKKQALAFCEAEGEDMIMLGSPIDPIQFGGKTFVAAMGGMETDQFAEQMALMSSSSYSNTGLVDKEGQFIVHPRLNNSLGLDEKKQRESDFFSVLEHHAVMEAGSTIQRIKDDMQENKQGMTVCSIDGAKVFLYYAPVSGTDWYVLSEMSYQVIGGTVEKFMGTTASMGLAVVLCVLGLVIILFAAVFRGAKAKRVAESMTKTLRETDYAKNQAEEALRKLAYYDELTGLANKNLLYRKAERFFAGEKRYAYVILDIRKFKVINDLFGYNRGDAFLKHIAVLLKGHCGVEEMAARASADIFHLLLIYRNKEELEERLHRLESQISGFTIGAEKSSFRITMSFGVYVVENPRDPIEQIADRAILALQKIKDLHTEYIFFYNNDIRNSIIEEQQIENEMQHGIDNGEFVVYFQPKYWAKDLSLAGAEALVRWKHPTRGIISPTQFIPAFEKNGFISVLDKYVMERVCQIMRAWEDEGLDLLQISVNQSRLLLYGERYANELQETLETYKIPHKMIEVEVTESVFLEDAQRMIDLMRQLQEMNFVTSMDDFGSGYSTLNMLKEITVDIMKIDKDFFSESTNSERGRKIVGSIIAMAKELKIVVVAEGVETREQVDFLRSVGCDLLQGYYFSKPLPNEEFENLLRERQTANLMPSGMQ